MLIVIVTILLTSNKDNSKKTFLSCQYDGNSATYVNGQYTYTHSRDGWSVKLTDKASKEPVTTKLCTTINGESVTNMIYMFYGSKATSIDLSSFDTSNVTGMSWMFKRCDAKEGYARTKSNADILNNTSNKSEG